MNIWYHDVFCHAGVWRQQCGRSDVGKEKVAAAWIGAGWMRSSVGKRSFRNRKQRLIFRFLDLRFRCSTLNKENGTHFPFSSSLVIIFIEIYLPFLVSLFSLEPGPTVSRNTKLALMSAEHCPNICPCIQKYDNSVLKPKGLSWLYRIALATFTCPTR